MPAFALTRIIGVSKQLYLVSDFNQNASSILLYYICCWFFMFYMMLKSVYLKLVREFSFVNKSEIDVEFLHFYLFFNWLHGVFVATLAFSCCSKQGLLSSCRLLIVVASLVAEQGSRVRGLSICGTWV